jgi:hypothetical protein
MRKGCYKWLTNLVIDQQQRKEDNEYGHANKYKHKSKGLSITADLVPSESRVSRVADFAPVDRMDQTLLF